MEMSNVVKTHAKIAKIITSSKKACERLQKDADAANKLARSIPKLVTVAE
jgi:hypothetical protein